MVEFIPQSIGNLVQLTQLQLYSNGLTGTIPQSIGNLVQLAVLNLRFNGLTGTIPQSIGNLVQLKFSETDDVTVGFKWFDWYYPTINWKFSSINVVSSVKLADLTFNGLTGTIPQSIGNMINLQYLGIINCSLSGTLPISICNLKNLNEIHMWNNTDLSGPIPNCIGEMTSLTLIDFSTLSLDSTIPKSICKLRNLKSIQIDGNNLTGSIPECIGDITSLTDWEMGFNNISSTIPESICKLTQLQQFLVNSNKLNGTYPNCFAEFPNLWKITIGNNQLESQIEAFPANIQIFSAFNNRLTGNFPVIPKTSMKQFKQIIVYNNRFTGSLSNIFQYASEMTDLSTVILNNNDFYDDNISSLLKDFFLLPKLESLSLANNPKIRGSVLEFENITNQTSLKYLLLNGMDLTGSLPKYLRFTNIQYLTLFDNRFSCDLPSDLVVQQASSMNNYTAMVLASNLFSCKTKEAMPLWISNSTISVADAESIYITQYDFLKDWVYTIASFFCFGLVIILQIFGFKQSKHTTNNIGASSAVKLIYRKHAMYHSNKAQLRIITQAMNQIQGQFSQYYIIYIITVILLVIYRYESKYFMAECITMLNSFGVAFYFSDVVWIDWCLVTVWIVLSAIYVHSVCILSIKSIKMAASGRNIHRGYISSSINDDDFDPLQSDYNSIKLVDSSRKDTTSNDEVVEHNALFIRKHAIKFKSRKSKLVQFFKTFVYFMLYVLCILLTCLYIICESLPSQNVLYITESEILLITKSMAFVLTVSNSIVVPKMVDNMNKLCHCSNSLSRNFVKQSRSIIVFSLRTLTAIIIPIIASIILLNDCGNGWTYFWSECVYKKDKFEIDYVIGIYNYATNPFLRLADASTICGMQPIIWSKCIRQFFRSWTNVIVLKLLLMVIMPFIVTTYKLVRKLCLSKIYSDRCYKRSNYIESYRIKMDVEYMMICSKIEVMLIFSFMTPFIIPITLLSIYVNLTVYHYLVVFKKADIFPFEQEFVFIPINMLIFGIIVSQIFIVVFTWISIGNTWINCYLLLSLFVVDVYFVITRFRKSKNENN
eukprot:528799_1